MNVPPPASRVRSSLRACKRFACALALALLFALPTVGNAQSSALASDQWRLLNFGSSSNSGNGADAADPDRDGLTNFAEYALLLDPLKPNVSWGVSAVQGGSLVVTYSRRTAALAEGSFTVMWAASPAGPWSVTGVTTQILSDNGTVQSVRAQVPITTTRLFLRVVMSRLQAAPNGAPSTATAVAVSNTQIDLTWADNSSNETGFQIERRAGPTGAFALVATVAANTRSYSDVGLASGMIYYYQIRASNTAGESAYSNTVNASVGALPIAPTSLNGVLSSGTQINLTWTDAATNETGFKIERRTSGGSFAEIGTRGTNVTSFQDTGLTAGILYIYRVCAYNGLGISAYTADERVGSTAPADPTGLAATVGAATRIDLTWVDAANNESGYLIERRPSGGTYAQIGTRGTDATSFQDTGVTAGIIYNYRIRATNILGNSSYSAEARITAGAPLAPSGLGVAVVATTRVDLSWTDYADNEAQFRIERRVSGGTFALLATVGANVTTYADNTLTSGVAYRYRVLASNAGGDSAYTMEASVTAGPPAVPTAFLARAVSSTQISLSWTDASSSETIFRIERKTGTAAFAEIGTMPPNSTTYQDVSLNPSTAYTYRILAGNAAGSSAYTASSTATTQAAPAAPTGWKVRRALGMYYGDETINLIPVAQPDGTIKIRDTVATVIPAGYAKYYLINESLYQGELENSGTYQPYMKLSIVKVIARGSEIWRYDGGDDTYVKVSLGGVAEVFTGTRH